MFALGGAGFGVLRVSRAADVEISNGLQRDMRRHALWEPLGRQQPGHGGRSPLMPPPADLESAAPLPPFDNMINRSIREGVRRHPASQERKKKKMWRGERAGERGCHLIELPEVMV